MPELSYLNADDVRKLTPCDELIAALQSIFTEDVVEPVRHHHFINVPDEPQATLLLMPAWLEGKYLGVKQVTVFPGNSTRSQPAINGSYTLSCGKTGQTLIQLDASELTARRTAAASALASRYLSREDSTHLLLIGAGRLARALVEAHEAVRSINTVSVWSRTATSAKKLVEELTKLGVEASYCPDNQLEAEQARADIISCATISSQAIVKGSCLQEGTHIDLVGAFRPDMRECDANVIRQAAVFVDTRNGALAEAGDLLQAEKEGAFVATDVIAELSELSCGQHLGRKQLKDSEKRITVFKSVGAAREDLAAAILAYESYAKSK